jgi:hypothetical protein
MAIVNFIKHKDIDFEKWDNTILNSEIPFVFAQSFYLNATCPNWDALIIGDYESVFPLTHKTKYGITYLPQPPFTSQLGAYGFLSEEIELQFYTYILNHYKLIEIELNISNQLNVKNLIPKNTYTINYNEGYSFNHNTKRNISKAINSGLHVTKVDFEEGFKLSKEYLNPFLKNNLALSLSTISVFEDLLNSANKQSKLYTFKVTDKENELKALGHFITNGKHAFYLKGTNFDKVDNSGSMHLLMSKVVDFFSDSTIIFDFGGGSQTGLANFYMGLGGKVMTYNFLKVNNLPWLIKLIKK